MRRGSFRTTSFDVAALAGVSQSAVSRAFTPGSSIAEVTRTKVLEAAKKLNYVPNSIASSLTTHRSNIVAVILGNLGNPFYVHVLELFSRELQNQNRQILTFTLGDNMATDQAIMKVLQYQVDAVVVTSAQLSTRTISLCHDRGIPVVLFNRYIPNSGAFGVRCDNAAGGRQIAEAFVRAGARSFLMITGDPNGTTSQDRVRGFVERLLEAGIPREALIEYPGWSKYEGAKQAMQQFMADRKKVPDAIFGINDIMAMGAIDALKIEFGLRIPEDVMVAGFDDIPEGARLPYQLTTVRQPIRRMVAATIDLLHLDDPERPIEMATDTPIVGEFIWRKTIPGEMPEGAVRSAKSQKPA
jgi:DNA-binding LacI/PurR family transcriptional regulator